MGGDTLPATYEISIREDNILIQGVKLAPRPPIPYFLDMPTHQPMVAPIPTTSTSQPLAIAPMASTYFGGKT